MKTCIMQPPYSTDGNDAERLFQAKLDLLEQCDESLDLIVLPEYSEVPCATSTREETLAVHERYIEPLLDACKKTAKRCGAVLFVNVLTRQPGGYRNTTLAFNRAGEQVGSYFKRHLPPSEAWLDNEYTMAPGVPDILEIDGVRYAFLTCYDFYFYEEFPAIARQKPDVIIGCSLQRSDTHEAIEVMCRFLAYNTNAYVVRSSVSFAEDSTICGASMIVAPTGKVLANLKGRFGLATAEFDPADKYYKPAGYGSAPAPHYVYIEAGRKPWLYRNAGTAMIPNEATLPYPRVCAHQGWRTIAPENSLPAYGAAVALGADEIEFDIWPTADGEFVSIHDPTLDRVSNGTGAVSSHTLAELQQLDFGVKFVDKFGAAYTGLHIVKFTDILEQFAGQTILNIHVKELDRPYPTELVQKIVDLLRQYDCEAHCYLMLTSDEDIRRFKAAAPEIACCVGHDDRRPWEIVDRAITLGAQKVQLFKPFYNQEMIDKAHAHGIRCNLFYADDPDEARRAIEMGVDTILTNDYLQIASAVGRYGIKKR